MEKIMSCVSKKKKEEEENVIAVNLTIIIKKGAFKIFSVRSDFCHNNNYRVLLEEKIW